MATESTMTLLDSSPLFALVYEEYFTQSPLDHTTMHMR